MKVGERYWFCKRDYGAKVVVEIISLNGEGKCVAGISNIGFWRNNENGGLNFKGLKSALTLLPNQSKL